MIFKKHKMSRLFIYTGLVLLLFSCKKFVDVELTGSRITEQVAFADDNTATSAMIGIYYNLSTSSIGSGSASSLSRLAALSSDELYDFRRTPNGIEFHDNELRPANAFVMGLWNSLYRVVFDANSLMEGLNKSNGVSPALKKQLIGEALFVRAFCYYYLVNFFGDVPLVLTADFVSNSAMQRTDSGVVYQQMISDLTTAKDNMMGEYVGGRRTRANAGAASALLAKVYLSMGNWQMAEQYASHVVDDPQYQIVQDLRGVFLIGSQEAIWQIAPPEPLNVTDEASFYVVTRSPRALVLRNQFVDSFDNSDLRRLTWIGSATTSSGIVYYPHKYTLQASGLPTKEYSIILRLADMYLIRAEAKVRQNDVAGATADVNVIRKRAGFLPLEDSHPAITQDDLEMLIVNERKLELFTEWGSRWFDLKRLGLAEVLLKPLKPTFTKNDELYPLPEQELRRNTKLGDQNPGY